MSTETIGFIGLGNMGQPMARRLEQAGYGIAAYDVNSHLLAAMANTRLRIMISSAQVAANARTIITILPTSSIVEQALIGPNGVFTELQPGTVIIEMSSGNPTTTQTLAAQARTHNAQLVDAPVSGGVPRAITGELSIMYGGSEETLTRIKPVLHVMGSSITRTGDVGTAHAMKALNNLVSAGGFLIGVEALVMGKRFGLDPTVMVDVLNNSTGMNNSTQKKFKQFVLSGQYNAGFSLNMMVKDLSIALSLDTNDTARFSQHCLNIWRAADES